MDVTPSTALPPPDHHTHSPTSPSTEMSGSRPSLCQHAGTDVDGWLPPDPDPRGVPAHHCPPSTATLCIDRFEPRSDPPHVHRTKTLTRVLVPLSLCGAATMVVKTASFGATRRLLTHTPNPIQPPHCPAHCPTGPQNCPVSCFLSPQCSLVLVQRRRRRALRPPQSCLMLEMPPSSVEQGHAAHTKVAPTGQQLDSALLQ